MPQNFQSKDLLEVKNDVNFKNSLKSNFLGKFHNFWLK